MATISVSKVVDVDYDVDLEQFDTDVLIEELESRGHTVDTEDYDFTGYEENKEKLQAAMEIADYLVDEFDREEFPIELVRILESLTGRMMLVTSVI